MSRRSMRTDPRTVAANARVPKRPPAEPGAASMGTGKRRRILTHGRSIRNFHSSLNGLAGALKNVPVCALLALVLFAPWSTIVAQSESSAGDSNALAVLLQRGELGPTVDAQASPRLAAWLSARLARSVRVDASHDALTHWQRVRAGTRHEVVLEEAHFLDYRVRRHDYEVIARARQDTRFAIVVAPGTLVSGLADLQARRMAVPSPPGLAALRVHQLFPDPALAPVLVVPTRVDEALAWVSNGRVAAAVVAAGDESLPLGLRPVVVTDALPGPGVAVAPSLDVPTRRALLRALVAMAADEDGPQLLRLLGHDGFQPASNSVYEGAHALLRGTWGYR